MSTIPEENHIITKKDHYIAQHHLFKVWITNFLIIKTENEQDDTLLSPEQGVVHALINAFSYYKEKDYLYEDTEETAEIFRKIEYCKNHKQLKELIKELETMYFLYVKENWKYSHIYAITEEYNLIKIFTPTSEDDITGIQLIAKHKELKEKEISQELVA